MAPRLSHRNSAIIHQRQTLTPRTTLSPLALNLLYALLSVFLFSLLLASTLFLILRRKRQLQQRMLQAQQVSKNNNNTASSSLELFNEKEKAFHHDTPSATTTHFRNTPLHSHPQIPRPHPYPHSTNHPNLKQPTSPIPSQLQTRTRPHHRRTHSTYSIPSISSFSTRTPSLLLSPSPDDLTSINNNSSSKHLPQIPQILITLPDEIDTETGKQMSGRVVVLHMGDNGVQGLEPWDRCDYVYGGEEEEEVHDLKQEKADAHGLEPFPAL